MKNNFIPMKEKNSLILFLSPLDDAISFGYRNTQTMYTYDSDSDSFKKKIHRNDAWTKEIIVDAWTKETPYFSDFATAYILDASYKYAYNALKTIYTRSANDKVYSLMVDVYHMRNLNIELIETLKHDVSLDDVTIVNAMPDSKKYKWILADDVRADDIVNDGIHHYKIKNDRIYKRILNQTEIYKSLDDAHHKRETKSVSHTRKKDNFTGRYIETIPYETIENTVYGRYFNDAYKAYFKDASNISCTDVVSVSRLALTEIVSLTDDIYHVRFYNEYIYKRINDFVMKERSFTVNNRLYASVTTSTTDDATVTNNSFYETSVITLPVLDSMLENVDRMETLKTIENVLVSKLDKRTNKDNIIYTFRQYYILERTLADIAIDLKVSEMMVSKYTKRIKTIIMNDSDIVESLQAIVNDNYQYMKANTNIHSITKYAKRKHDKKVLPVTSDIMPDIVKIGNIDRETYRKDREKIARTKNLYCENSIVTGLEHMQIESEIKTSIEQHARQTEYKNRMIATYGNGSNIKPTVHTNNTKYYFHCGMIDYSTNWSLIKESKKTINKALCDRVQKYNDDEMRLFAKLASDGYKKLPYTMRTTAKQNRYNAYLEKYGYAKR